VQETAESPKPGSICALQCCKKQHRHPLTGAEPDYHYRIGAVWEPRWKNPMKRGEDTRSWWYTTVEIAARLGCRRETVVNFIKRGELRASQVGEPSASGRHQYYVNGGDFDDWMRGQTRWAGRA